MFKYITTDIRFNSPILRTCASTNSKYQIRTVIIHFTFIKLCIYI